ncbi:MAG: heme peroxidase family protein [Armatimonadota bacterium]
MQSTPGRPMQDARMFQDSLYRAEVPISSSAMPDDFNKLFPALPPFAECKEPYKERVVELGKKFGLMDAHDPRITVTNPLAANDEKTPHPDQNLAERNVDNQNPDMTVGFTFLGQFIDHDLTFDPMPIDCAVTASPNLRSRFFDLDSVYGRGPREDRLLYDRASELDRGAPIKFFVDFDAPRDLPRTSQERAIIADPRNDENVIISQLHLAFLKFHNEVTDYLAPKHTSKPPSELFEIVRKEVRRHYQWIVVNQFLAATLDSAVFDAIKASGPTVYTGGMRQKIPREFQVAAYRFGHSQIRPGYKVNIGFGAPIFDARIDPREADPNDLRGGRRALRRFVEWDTFFDFGTLEAAPADDTATPAVTRPKVKKNKRIDPFISSPMFELPPGPGLVDPGDPRVSLAVRNLERHLQHGVASGQEIATALGYTPLTPDELKELKDLGFDTSTPLWYYVLKEALLQQHGQRLGQVGSRIIAEVFFGLLMDTPGSYLNETGWKPTLPRRDGTVGDFTMTDLLTFAGVA